MKKLLFLLFLALFSCSSDSDNALTSEKKKTVHTETKNNDQITYKLIFREDLGWGYQVFLGSKLFINQEHIPAIQGMKGFDTREKAEITVLFVIEKIEKGETQPTLSVGELDSLKVL